MLNLQNISKSFSGVRALHDVSLNFHAGRVHALCGENGAGKSTLMNIIVGNLQPDAGRIFWNENELNVSNIRQAQALGIAIVYQERSLVDSLTVAENIFPNHQPVNKWGFIDYAGLSKKAQALLDELNMDSINPSRIVSKLSSEQKQMVEIAKALSHHPSLLILDEPTASLTSRESATLFQIIRRLKASGVAVIYISHRMDEIKEIADDISILKDGEYQGTINASTATNDQIIQMMVGRTLQNVQYEANAQQKVRLDVSNLTGAGFRNLNFQIHHGEILGFAGLLGSGRTKLARAIFGVEKVHSGHLKKDGKLISPRGPREAMQEGIAYLPDDRKSEGLFLEKSVLENLAASQLSTGWYKAGSFSALATKYKEKLNIRMSSGSQRVRNLSGGNQQKIMLAKWLATNPDLLLVNEPTHGVDVGAKAEIYGIIKGLAREGKSILMISSELPELLLLCDRIAVMYRGEIRSILSRAEATEERITALASGL